MMRRSKTSTTRPSHHVNDTATAFTNPWPSAEKATYTELLFQSSFPLSWYNETLDKHERAKDIKVVTPDWGEASLKERKLQKAQCMVGTWLGHAGVMLELPLEGTGADGAGKKSLWVLFDPIFSTRAGPTQYTGPQRMKKSPCQVSDLPACDAVVISHNHYDHLDLSSIKDIYKRFPQAKYFVPLGNKSWLTSTGVPEEQIHQMDWWQKREFSPTDFGYATAPGGTNSALLRFTCVPAQHNSGRGIRDQGSTLWCGWILEQFLQSNGSTSPPSLERKGAIYHAGDTGYRRTAKSTAVCPVFQEIGKQFGTFDLSFVPIWRGGSLSFVSSLGLRLSHQDIPATFHASPADAIAIHKDVKSRNSIGVHFGTFIGSEFESHEAVIEFDEAREKAGVRQLNDPEVGECGRVGVLDIGGSIAIKIE